MKTIIFLFSLLSSLVMAQNIPRPERYILPYISDTIMGSVAFKYNTSNYYAYRPDVTDPAGNFFENDYISTSLTNGMQLWLPFSAPFVSTQYDFSVRSNDASVTIAPSWIDLYGGGMVWTGGTQRLSIPITPELQGTNQATWMVWCNMINAGVNGFGRIINSYQNTGNGFIFGINSTQIRLLSFDNGTQYTLESAAGLFPTGRVAMVSISQSNTTVNMYVDGVLIKSGSLFAQKTSAGPIQIGNGPPASTTRPINGTLYDVKIFNRMLSSNEHFEIYNLTLNKYQYP